MKISTKGRATFLMVDLAQQHSNEFIPLRDGIRATGYIVR